jgi:ubiquitin C-terminal hydrolase
MAETLYRLYCEMCSFNRYTDGTDVTDLIPYKRCDVQTSVPKLDPISKKVTTKKPISLPKQFKCPNCGRLITARKVVEPPKEVTNEDFDSGGQAGDGGLEIPPVST